MRRMVGAVRGPLVRAARDLAAVGVAAPVVLAVTASVGSSDRAAVYDVLTLTAAAVGAAAAILADLAARLRDVPRVAWSGAAFGVYSVVIIPSTTLGPDGPNAAAGLVAMRLVAYLTVLVLLLLAVVDSRRGGAWGGWAIAGAGTALALVAGQLLALAPDSFVHVVLHEYVGIVALVGWCWVALTYIQQGIRLDRPPLWRMGSGLGVLAGAQIYRITNGFSPGEPAPGFAALRLLGVVVVAVAVGGFWIFVLRSFRTAQLRQDEELRIAAVHLHRAAEMSARRDHELRNGIGGLSGITALLGDPDEDHTAGLRSAVLAELGRLSRMVENGVPDADEGADAAVVLTEIAALHRARGIDITVHFSGELHVDTPDDALRQVVANLLVNAERHAPGRAVELSGWREGTVVVVEVRDHGPGVPPGEEAAVFEPGVRDPTAGGSGLGLHISRLLMAQHGGTLEIRPADPARPGCAAVLTLPAAERERIDQRVSAEIGVNHTPGASPR